MSRPDDGDHRRQPDVSVIVPVYNTMPYLTRCLESVRTQSIGVQRLQIVAVDDGSTDGSGAELDRLAREHPDLFTVVHQNNSGGPALPCNRGLDLAAGRYVFFLGADDFLGEECLERLVDRADEWSSDVIFGTMRGVNGRFVDQKIYARTEKDVDFLNSALCYSLSNTKLFRRSLIDAHGIRFAPDLRVGSDQPFVVTALTRARRVSVLTDYVYYFAVKRDEASNITYTADWRSRLGDISAVMHHIGDAVEPGPVRDAILTRHFTMEIGKLLRLDLPQVEPAEKAEIVDGVRALMDAFWSDGLSFRLGAQPRVRLRLAQAGQLELLQTVLDYQRTVAEPPPLVLRGRKTYVWFPGFGAPETSPDWYALTTENAAGRIEGSVRVDVARVQGGLEIRGRIGLTEDSAPNVTVALIARTANPLPESATAPGDGASAATEIPVRLRQPAPGAPSALCATLQLRTAVPDLFRQVTTLHDVALRVRVGDRWYDYPVRGRQKRLKITLQHRLTAVRVDLAAAGGGPLVIRSTRLPRRQGIRRGLRRYRGKLTNRVRELRSRALRRTKGAG